MRPGDRLICAFVTKLSSGYEFRDWPLHVTVIPWFRTDTSSDDLAQAIKAVLGSISPFEVRIGDEAIFGRGKTVNLIQRPTTFSDIEELARAALKRSDVWLVDETTKKKRSYKPHVTAQKQARLHEGEGFWCESLYIVEQNGDYKTLAAEINL